MGFVSFVLFLCSFVHLHISFFCLSLLISFVMFCHRRTRSGFSSRDPVLWHQHRRHRRHQLSERPLRRARCLSIGYATGACAYLCVYLPRVYGSEVVFCLFFVFMMDWCEFRVRLFMLLVMVALCARCTCASVPLSPFAEPLLRKVFCSHYYRADFHTAAGFDWIELDCSDSMTSSAVLNTTTFAWVSVINILLQLFSSFYSVY